MDKERMQKITEKVISKIETEGLTWLKTWKGFKWPKNLESKKDYRGFNTLSCLWTMQNLGTSNPYFLTMRQIDKLNARVKAGEKGTPIIYYRVLEKKRDGEDDVVKIPLLRYYYVWNITQTTITIEPEPEREVNSIEVCEKFVEGYSDKPLIIKGNYNPHYRPDEDKVCLPDDSNFKNDELRYQTLFHELVHSTGHEKRLNRNIRNPFGSEEYGKEELLAELTTIFICNLAGIERETQENSEAYLQGWAKNIRQDPKILLKTMRESQKILDYMRVSENPNREDGAEITVEQKEKVKALDTTN